jgi:CheY-like chemotaxis protein
VDDDADSFLDKVVDFIKIPNITFKRFSDPRKAMDYVNEESGLNNLDCFDLARGGEESTSDWKSILLNINCLHKEIYSLDRFSRISTIITDYSMAGMNGVELSASVMDPNIQKILLTAIADEMVAINAFNDGLINRFMKKEQVDFEGEIKRNVSKSVRQYFRIHTEDISKNLSVYGKTHLRDPIFANFFSSICEGKDYVEYYMLDTLGGYLFLDAEGNPSFLCVLTEPEISRVVDIAIESGEVAQDILEALQSREYMLVSHNCSGQLPPLEEWRNYLRPARRLDGYQTYYFAFGGAESLDLNLANIKSFDRFCRLSRN